MPHTIVDDGAASCDGVGVSGRTEGAGGGVHRRGGATGGAGSRGGRGRGVEGSGAREGE